MHRSSPALAPASLPRERSPLSRSLPRKPESRSRSMRGLARRSPRPRCFAELTRKELEEKEAGAVRREGWCPVAWPRFHQFRDSIICNFTCRIHCWLNVEIVNGSRKAVPYL